MYMVDGQTSYDPRFISELIGGRVHLGKELAALFGVPETVWPDLDARAARLVEDAAPINFLSQDAPPVLCVYSLARNHVPDIHHPRFADDLKERMDALDLECTVVVDEELQDDNEEAKRKLNKQLGDFLDRYLNIS